MVLLGGWRVISRLILKVTCSTIDLLCGAQSFSQGRVPVEVADEWRRVDLIAVPIL